MGSGPYADEPDRNPSRWEMVLCDDRDALEISAAVQ